MTVQLFDQPIFVTLWVYFVVTLWFFFAYLVMRDGFQRTRSENQRDLVTALFLCVGAVLLSEAQKPASALHLLHLNTEYELLPVNVSVIITVNAALRVVQSIFAITAFFLILRVASCFRSGIMFERPPGAPIGQNAGNTQVPSTSASVGGTDSSQREMNSTRPLGKEHQSKVIERTTRK